MSRRALLCLLPLATCLALAGSPAPPSAAEVDQLIRAFGPVMKLYRTERYLMDDPDYILNSGKTALEWGLVHHEQDYNSFAIEGLRSAALPSEAALAGDVERARHDARAARPDFRYWLRIGDSLLAGNLSRAKALVSVWLAPDGASLDLQFWFFYPFNGPGKFLVTMGKLIHDQVILNTCGRHYGDWEHVTLRLARTHEPAGLPWRLVDVYLSRHSISKWMGGVEGLRFSGGHPVIYVARDSHAHYPSAGTQHYRRAWSKNFWLGTAALDLEDWTGDGPAFRTFDPGHYQIMASNIPGWTLAPPAWYSFAGSWGQYEKLMYSYAHIYTYKEIGGGPSGPAFHGPDGAD